MPKYRYKHHDYTNIIEAESAAEAWKIASKIERQQPDFIKCSCSGGNVFEVILLEDQRIFEKLARDKNTIAKIFKLATGLNVNKIKTKADFIQVSASYEGNSLFEFIQIDQDLNVTRYIDYNKTSVENMDEIRKIFSELKI